MTMHRASRCGPLATRAPDELLVGHIGEPSKLFPTAGFQNPRKRNSQVTDPLSASNLIHMTRTKLQHRFHKAKA